jgi:hypothetical protein
MSSCLSLFLCLWNISNRMKLCAIYEVEVQCVHW